MRGESAARQIKHQPWTRIRYHNHNNKSQGYFFCSFIVPCRCDSPLRKSRRMSKSSLTSDGGRKREFSLVEFRRCHLSSSNRRVLSNRLLSPSLRNAIIGSDIDGDVVHVRQFQLRLCVYEVGPWFIVEMRSYIWLISNWWICDDEKSSMRK